MKAPKWVPLTGDNYFSWKATFTATLRGYRLVPYVEGKITLEPDSVLEHHDQFILSWIFSAVSTTIQPKIASMTTSALVWKKLERMYSVRSEMRYFNLRHKLQFVRKGEVEGCDYNQTFSLKANSVRIVLTVAVSRGWQLHQIDISNVFLNGRLEERIVVSQLAEFVDKEFTDYVSLAEILVSRFDIQQVHWIALKRILRFFSGTQNYGIVLKKVINYSISGFCDAGFFSGTHTCILVYLGDTTDIP